MILQNDEILRLFELGKMIKSANILMAGNMMLGSDEQFFTLRTIELEDNVPFIDKGILSYNHTELNNAIKEGYIPETLYNNSMIYNILCDKYRTVNSIMNFENDSVFSTSKTFNTKCTQQYTELEQNDMFSYMLSKKAADGAMNTMIDDICIYLSSTMFNKNKSDKVDLYIYSPKFLDWELAEFIIKKKKYTVKQYMKFLKLY